jgi:D-sedoheptulose 7-phosphate isomerase
MGLNSGTSPTAYLSAFTRLFDEVEFTDRNGRGLTVDEGVAAAVELVLAMRRDHTKVIVIGNGGSCAIASHLHNDLCKAVGVRAMVFNELALLTAMANDDGYHTVFHRPLDLWADRGDLLIAVSSSGESSNIIKAATLSADKGCRLLTMSGFKPGNALRRLGDVNVYVPAGEYGYVEMAHSVIGHCITDLAIARLAADI